MRPKKFSGSGFVKLMIMNLAFLLIAIQFLYWFEFETAIFLFFFVAGPLISLFAGMVGFYVLKVDWAAPITNTVIFFGFFMQLFDGLTLGYLALLVGYTVFCLLGAFLMRIMLNRWQPYDADNR